MGRLLLKGDVMQWLSLNLASVSLKLNLEVSKARLERLTKASKRLSVVLRSYNSNKMRITKRKLRRLKKLLLSTWLNIARPSKSWRKLRKGLKWLELHFHWPVQALLCEDLQISPESISNEASNQQLLIWSCHHYQYQQHYLYLYHHSQKYENHLPLMIA